MTPLEALLKAIEIAKSQSALATTIGTAQPRISEWVKQGQVGSPQFVLPIEAATGVSRHLLRPDIFGSAATRTDSAEAAA